MAPRPQFYDATGTSQISAAVSASVTSGSSVAVVEYELWNDKGALLGADTLTAARLVMQVFDGTDWVSSGEPAADEAWYEVQLTGIHNTGDPDMLNQTTGYVRLGANRSLPLLDIPQNCARILNLRISVPSGATTDGVEMRLAVRSNETSAALSDKTNLWVGGGVIPARHDSSVRQFTAGRRVTAGGTALVSAANGHYVYDGTPYFVVEEDVTLNQTAADGALAATESYIARLSQAVGSTITTTKSNGAVTPTAPALPADHIFIADITVAYQGGGTSAIVQADVDQDNLIYGEYHVYAGSGLNVIISPGEAVSSTDTKQFKTATTTLAVVEAELNYIWLHPDGTFSRTGDDPEPPEVGCVLLATAEASVGVVTSVVTTVKPYAERAINEYAMILRYWGAVGTGTDLTWDVLPFAAVLESVTVEHGVQSLGTATDNTYDINYRAAGSSLPTSLGGGTTGTTIYTSQATSDYRPVIENGGVGPVTVVEHEVRVFDKGTRFSLDCDVAASTNPVYDVFATLKFRRA